MDSKQAQEALVTFIRSETDFRDRLIRRIAEENLSKSKGVVTEKEVIYFQEMHKDELEKKADKLIVQVSKKLLPENWSASLARSVERFDIWTVLMIPPLYPLSQYASFLFHQDNPDWTTLASVIVSILLLVLFPLASLYHNLFKRKK